MPDQTFQVPEDFFEARVEEFKDEDTVGFLLAGSHARGDASSFSDVDLIKFVDKPPKAAMDRYIVKMRDRILACLTVTTVDAKLDELRKPETAIWAVPGVRQSRILLDRDGSIEKLKLEATQFEWADVQDSADAYAANELGGLAEEAHKLPAAWLADDRAAGEYAILGMLLGCTRTAAVKLGVMIPSENVYFRVVREAAGIDSDWSRCHARAIGGGPVKERIAAAMSLYVETAALIGAIADPDTRVVVAETTRLMKDLSTRNKL